MLFPISIGLLATTLLSRSANAINQEVDPAESILVRDALTQNDAYNAMSDSDFVYNWNNITSNPYDPGSVLWANIATWPILARGHSSVSQINLGACAMLSPHSHRATKIAIVIAGSVRTYMRMDNGATDRTTMLTPGMMTIFPAGAMHGMMNTGCTPAILYSFFDSHDPGTLNFGQAFMSAGPDVGMTVFPFIQQVNSDWNDIAAEVPSIGMGAQNGTAACMRLCKMI